MNSNPLANLSKAYADSYARLLENTDYRELQLGEMVAYLMQTSWKNDYAKFVKLNAVLIQTHDLEPTRLEPAWYVARIFAGGSPTFGQVAEVYKAT